MFDFSMNIDSMATSVPLLQNGFYAGILTKFSVETADGDSTIKVSEVREPAHKGSKEMVPTGRFKLRGSATFTVTLTSQKAIKVLGVDEPKRFGRINLEFDQTTGRLDPNKNIAFVKLIRLFDVNPKDIESALDVPSIMESVVIPEELSQVDNIETLLKAAAYYHAFFTLLGKIILDSPIMVEIKRQAAWNDNTVMEDRINVGTYSNPSLGLIAYVPDSEFDTK